MQPMINLQLNEFTHFDAVSNTAALLPSDATELSGSFADLLRSGLEGLPGFELQSGQSLPEEGELLPPAPQALATEGGPPGGLIPEEEPVDAPGSGSGDALENPTVALPVTMVPVTPPAFELSRSPLAAAAGVVLGTTIGEPYPQRQNPLNTQAIHPATASSGSELRDPTAANLTSIPGRTTAEPELRRERLSGSDALSVKALATGAALTTTSPALAQSETMMQRIGDLQALDSLPQFVQASGNPQSQIPATAAPVTSGSVAINTPVQDSSWGQRVGEQVLLLVNNKLQNAEIRLSPAELGPLHVKIALDEGSTNITFHVQHAVTREAIEQALPKLRELLSENGLSLGQTNIGEQDVNQEQQRADRDAAEARDVVPADVAEIETDNAVTEQRSHIKPVGLLDTFV